LGYGKEQTYMTMEIRRENRKEVLGETLERTVS
jgi:hypothetical protein